MAELDVSFMKNIYIALFLLGSVHADESIYHNPVDGTNYTAEWKVYAPTSPKSESPDEVVTIGATRLLTTQEIFENNIDVEELASFLHAIRTNVEKSVNSKDSNFALLIDTKITKDRDPEFSMANQGTVSDKQLQAIYDGLQKLKGFHSKAEDLKFQIELQIDAS